MTYEKLHANGTRSPHKDYEVDQRGNEFSIPGSIRYSGGFNSDEVKGCSEGYLAAPYQGLSHKTSIDQSRKLISAKVPVARKQNFSDDSSEASFSYDECTKHAEKEYLASRSEN